MFMKFFSHFESDPGSYIFVSLILLVYLIFTLGYWISIRKKREKNPKRFALRSIMAFPIVVILSVGIFMHSDIFKFYTVYQGDELLTQYLSENYPDREYEFYNHYYSRNIDLEYPLVIHVYFSDDENKGYIFNVYVEDEFVELGEGYKKDEYF